MNKSLRLYWLVLVVLGGNFGMAAAQTISTGSLPVSSICAGSTISVPFITSTASGTFAAGNQFKVQIAPAVGAFTDIGTSAFGPITATIPSDASGSGYRVRVISTSPVVNGSISATSLTVTAIPGAPGTSDLSYCQGVTPSPLTATSSSGATLKWWGTSASGGSSSPTAPTPSAASAGVTNYYVSQTINGCEGPRAEITVTVNAIPAAPATSAAPAYCQNSAASPLVVTPSAGASLNWYGTSQTGGTASSNAPTPSTDAVGTVTYYVSQSIGTCEGPRASIAVTVNSKPAPPAVTTPITACLGTPLAALSATPGSGNTLNWYGTSASGGVASTTAPTPGTASAGTTNYYVSQKNAGGCESERAVIAVTIKASPNPPGVNPISFCQNAPASALTATPSDGGSLNWYGTAATGGTASATAPSPPTNAAGTTTYYVSQTISGCEGPRAEITVTVNAIPAAPITSAAPAHCQNSAASPLVATPSAGASLNWYGTSQTGGTASSNAPTPSTSAVGTVTYYVSQSVGGCEGPRTGIVVTVTSRPEPPAVTGVVTACLGTSVAALSATPGSGNTLNWYGTNQTGGVASTTAPTPFTASAGTTNYYASQKNAGGCESERAVIAVTIKPLPGLPGVNPLSFCQNAPAAALTATPSDSGSLNWYGTATTGGTASATAPSPPTSAIGTTTYYVSQTVNGCEGSRAALVVTVKGVPAAPTTTTPPAYCQDAAATSLVATAGAGGTLNWYGTSQTGGTASETASIPTTNTPGTANYYVSQTVNGCESPRTAIAVTVSSKPVLPTVTTSFTYCQGATASQLTAVVSSGGTANWYGTNATGGTAAFAGPVPQTTTAGVNTYYVSQTVGGCEGNRASITVTIYATPTAPVVTAGASFCQNITASALVATPSDGGSLNWYGANQTGGTASATAPTPPTSAAGSATYYVSQTINGCEGPRASLVVTIKSQPSAPAISAGASYCQGSPSAPLSASVSSGGSLNWYGTSQTGGTGSSVAPTPSTDAAGTFTYYVSQTVVGCESTRSNLTVTIKAKPAVPGVQNSRYCQNETALPLTATSETGGTLKWYTTVTSPTSSSIAPTPSTQTADEYTFYVSQNGANGCESDRGAIRVRVFATPGVPGVPNTPEVCQNTASITLDATGESLKWYTDPTGGTVLGAAPVQNTTTAGTFTYYVSQTTNLCESPRTPAKVVIKPQPALPGVESKSVCQDSPEQTLAATGEAIKWFDSNGNVLGGAPRPTTNVEQKQVFTYSVTQTSNGCESQKAPITYTVNVTPKPTVVTPVIYCQNATARPLEATGDNLKWINPYGNESSTAPTPPTMNISTKPEGDSYFVTQKVGSCESRKSEIKLIVNAPPTAKIEGNATVNLGKSVPVTISFTSIPPFSYTISDGTSGTAVATQKEITLLPTKKNTIYTITNVTNSCGAGTPVGTFTINAVIPTVTTNPLSVTTICVGTQIQIPFTTAGEFTDGNSFRVEIATVADTAFTNKIAILNGATQSPITAPIPTTLAQGLYRVRVTATNPQVPVPGSSSPTILNIRALPTVTLTGSKDIYDNESAPLSFALTGDGPWTFEYSDSLKTTKVTTSTNPYPIVVTPIRSTTYKAIAVLNSCGVGTATGTAIVRVLPVLGLEPDPLITAVKVFPVPTENFLTIDIDLPLQKEPAKLQLADQNGRISKQLTTRQRQTKLDLSQHASGLYFLQIQIGNRTTVRKIMKK